MQGIFPVSRRFLLRILLSAIQIRLNLRHDINNIAFWEENTGCFSEYSAYDTDWMIRGSNRSRVKVI